MIDLHTENYYINNFYTKSNIPIYLNPVNQIIETENYYYICGGSLTIERLSNEKIRYDNQGNRIVTHYLMHKDLLKKIKFIRNESRSGLIRFFKNGKIDLTWKTPFLNNVQITAFELLGNGNIVLAFDSLFSHNCTIVYYDSSGNPIREYRTINNTFLSGNEICSKEVPWMINQIKEYNGNIFVVGRFSTYKEFISVKFIIKLNKDGYPNNDFKHNLIDNGIGGYANGVAFQSDGKIILYGRFDKFNPPKISRSIIRLFSDGSLDTTFNKGGYGFDGEVFTCKVLKDNSIIVGGDFTSYNKQSIPFGLCKLTPDGDYDNSFNMNGTGFWSKTENDYEVHTINILPNDNLLIGGTFFRYNGSIVTHLVQLDENGNLVSKFDPSIDNSMYCINSLCVCSDGGLLIGGACYKENCDTNNSVSAIRLSKSQGYVEFYLLFVFIICILGLALFLFIRSRKNRSRTLHILTEKKNI
jgi:uncharacterized delta-60 repeat protein